MENFEKQFNCFDEKKFDDENKKEYEFSSEMEKPRKEWSDGFKSFIEEEVRKRNLEKEQEGLYKILEKIDGKKEEEWTEEEKNAYQKRKEYIDFSEKNSKEIIHMYFNDLELTKDEVISKKIMDIGCGGKAEFIEYAIEELNSKNVHGLDTRLEEKDLKKYPHNLHKNNFYEKLPINNLDLIIARASIIDEELTQEDFLKNILDSLGEGGELRVYPIFKNHFESNNKEALEMKDDLIKELNKLSKKLNFDYSLRIKEVSVYEEDNYPTSKNLLTIKKKKEELE